MVDFYRLSKNTSSHLKTLERKSGVKKIQCRFGSGYWAIPYFNFIQHRGDIINKAYYNIRSAQYYINHNIKK